MHVLTFVSIVFLGSVVTALPLSTTETDAALVKRQCGPPPLGSPLDKRCIPVAEPPVKRQCGPPTSGLDERCVPVADP
ncbi:hypothetical protein GGI43DRAFT_387713 [Trichoderma evansii]